MRGMVLDGVRVVDWTIAYAGPLAGAWLAALGADVVHIERPGEPVTPVTPSDSSLAASHGVPTRLGRFSIWEDNNSLKKSVALDLSQEKGKEIIYRLIRKADVFLTNQLPDTIEKLGLDYETVTKINPEIIYATNNVVGYKGPYRVTPGADAMGITASGFMSANGERGGPPAWGPWGVGDCTSAFALFCGIVVALLHRKNSGEGQRVDTSQMQALINIPLQAVVGVCGQFTEEQRKENPYSGIVRYGPHEDSTALTNNYKCKDDRWIHLGGGREKYFANLMRAIGRPDLLEDPKFATLEKRAENNKELIKILDEVFAQHTVQEWREKFHGHDVSFYPVNTLPDLFEDPQVEANEMLCVVEYPEIGPRTRPGMAFNLSKCDWKKVQAAPEHGQHTEEVLLDLGYSWEDILLFREEKVILVG